MPTHRVRAGAIYTFHPVPWDALFPASHLHDGDKVQVVNEFGCPPANTMGNCHVEDLEGKFLSMVHCNSLQGEEKMATKKAATTTSTTSVTVVFGNGDSKKHSVKFSPLNSSDVKPEGLGDLYISRTILDKIGVEDDGELTITFSK